MGARMTRLHDVHLTTEELDTLLEQAPGTEVQAHIFACVPCRNLAEADRRLVEQLRHLPQFSPRTGFSDHVMSRIKIQPAIADRFILRLPSWVHGGGRSVRRAAAVTVTLISGMAASIVWSLANRDLLSAWGTQTRTLLEGWAWTGLRTMAANLTAQPWYGAVRELVDSPGRLGLAAVILLTGYAAGLLALRRLVAIPSRSVPHVHR